MATTLLRTEQQVDDYVTSQQSLVAEAQALITEYSEFLSSDVSTLAESSRSIPNALSGFLATANAIHKAYEHYPPHASSLVKGTVQLSNATDSTDSTKAASAYALKKLWDYLQTLTVPDATTSVKGKAMLATSMSGDTTKFVTPSALGFVNRDINASQSGGYTRIIIPHSMVPLYGYLFGSANSNEKYQNSDNYWYCNYETMFEIGGTENGQNGIVLLEPMLGSFTVNPSLPSPVAPAHKYDIVDGPGFTVYGYVIYHVYRASTEPPDYDRRCKYIYIPIS